MPYNAIPNVRLQGQSHDTDRSQLLRLLAGLGKDTLPGIEAIGAGYNPFDNYASPRDIATPTIFNWKDAEQVEHRWDNVYQSPKAVGVSYIFKSWTRQHTGHSVQDYQENFSQEVNTDDSVGFCSGSLSTEFCTQSLTRSESSFSRVQFSVALWALELPIDSGTRKLLNKEFRNRLDSLDASNADACKNFFSEYGSHILTGIVIGGRTVQTASTDKYRVDRTYSLDALAVAFNNLRAGMESDPDKDTVEDESALSSFQASSNISSITVGGNPSLGERVFDGEASTLQEWHISVIENPIFVDFAFYRPLVPIWELCANDARGQKVRSGLSSYYKNHWAPENISRRRIEPDYIDSIHLIEDQEPTPQGHEILQHGIPSPYYKHPIRICYRKARYSLTGLNKPAIIDFVVARDTGSPPAGYTKLDKQFGFGTYIFYSTSEYNSATAIIDVAVGGPMYSVDPPESYVRVGGSLGNSIVQSSIHLYYARKHDI